MSTYRKRKTITAGRVILVLLAVLALVLCVSFYLSNFTIILEEVTVTLPQLPSNFDGMRIAHLSDLHGKDWGENNQTMLDMLTGANPDIIVITGDMIDNPDDLEWVGGAAADIVDIAPTYIVSGNHEWYLSSYRPFREAVIAAGATLLDGYDETLERDGQEIKLIGFADPNGVGVSQLDQQMYEFRVEHNYPFTLALSHRFDRFDDYQRVGLDLVLAGHAHGGLIRLPFTDGLISPAREFFPKYTNGLYMENGTAMVVSRGTESLKKGFRLFNRPHVLIVTLRNS